MNRSHSLLSFLALAFALAAWICVWFLYADVSGRLSERASTLSTLSTQSSQRSSAIARQALVADTATQRSQLDEVVATDVVGIANDINAAGKVAGTQTSIGSASVVGSSQEAGVNELEFVVESTGSFQQVWQAAELFQALPVPSAISRLDLEEIPNSGKGSAQWQLTVHIDVLTSAQISS